MSQRYEERWKGSPAARMCDAVGQIGAALDEEPDVLPVELAAELSNVLLRVSTTLGIQQGSTGFLLERTIEAMKGRPGARRP